MAYNRLTGRDDPPDPATDEERYVAEAVAYINRKVAHMEERLNEVRKLWFTLVALVMIGLIAMAYTYEWKAADNQGAPSAASETGK